MKIFILASFLLTSSIHFGQTATALLDFNNVAAYLSTNGHFFNNQVATSSGYEIPKGSGINAIFSNSFWFGGTDVNGQIRLSAQKYSADGDQDYWPGPLSTFGGQLGYYGDAQITPGQMTYYDQIWTLSDAQIQNHIQNYNTAGYTPISGIATWPAHGDASLGEAYYLAPFVDVNSDGDYDPMDGDYPKIKGDKAAYMILNDKGNIHSSGGNPIGLELHIMTYQFATNDFLDNTTFVNIRYINRSTQTLYNFKFSNFLDADLGDGGDDFMGTNASKNLVYAYNGNNVDASYGLAPPAMGVMTLCAPIHSSSYFNQSNLFSQVPIIASSYYGFMSGQWGNTGTLLTQGGNGHGGTTPTNFVYDDINTWSEISESNIPGDTKMILTNDPISDGTLRPGYQGNIELAFIYARDTNNIASVNALFNVADSIQTFFNQTFPTACSDGILSDDSHPIDPSESISIYPNPAKDQFKVSIAGHFDLTIYDISGKVIGSIQNITANQNIKAPRESGIYLLKINKNEKVQTLKLVIE